MQVKIGAYIEGGKYFDISIEIEKDRRVIMYDKHDTEIASFDPEDIKALAAIVEKICV